MFLLENYNALMSYKKDNHVGYVSIDIGNHKYDRVKHKLAILCADTPWSVGSVNLKWSYQTPTIDPLDDVQYDHIYNLTSIVTYDKNHQLFHTVVTINDKQQFTVNGVVLCCYLLQDDTTKRDYMFQSKPQSLIEILKVLDDYLTNSNFYMSNAIDKKQVTLT